MASVAANHGVVGLAKGKRKYMVKKEQPMRAVKGHNRWLQERTKKRSHWAILTLDDLPKPKVKYNQLIVQIRARYQAAEKLGDQEDGQTSEDFSI